MQGDKSTIEAVTSQNNETSKASEAFGALSSPAVFAVFAVIFLVTYLPCYTTSYGLLDDYFLLFSTLTKGAWCPEIVGNMMSQGRPLNLPFIAAAFSSLHGIGDLWVLRAIATLGTALLATLFFRHSVNTGWSKAQSFTLSLLVFSQLPFQVLSAWSLVGFLGAIRIPLGYLSYFQAKVAGEKTTSSPAFLLRFAAALITLTASMAMHQTAAMFFWIGFAQDLLSPKGSGFTRKQLATIFTIFGASCSLEFLISIYGKSHYAAYLIQDRKDLSFDPLSKLYWFFCEPLTSCLNFNNLNANEFFAIGVGVLIAVGLWLYMRVEVKDNHQSKTLGLFLLALPFLCYTPNLIIAESWASYRTMYALAALTMLYIFCAIQGFAKKLAIRQGVITGALLAAASINLITANLNVTNYICAPQSRELALLKYRLDWKPDSQPVKNTINQLSTPKDKGPFDIWPYGTKVITLGWNEELAPAAFYDEFGRPSSARPFVAKAMIGLIQQEKGEASAAARK